MRSYGRPKRVIQVLRSFPKAIRTEFGLELYRLQLGEMPLDSNPMKSIGQGVFELRQRDENGWYRVIYLAIVGNKFHVLHSFVKRSAKTPAKDLSTAENRLKVVKSRLQEEKKNERRASKLQIHPRSVTWSRGQIICAGRLS